MGDRLQRFLANQPPNMAQYTQRPEGMTRSRSYNPGLAYPSRPPARAHGAMFATSPGFAHSPTIPEQQQFPSPATHNSVPSSPFATQNLQAFPQTGLAYPGTFNSGFYTQPGGHSFAQRHSIGGTIDHGSTPYSFSSGTLHPAHAFRRPSDCPTMITGTSEASGPEAMTRNNSSAGPNPYPHVTTPATLPGTPGFDAELIGIGYHPKLQQEATIAPGTLFGQQPLPSSTSMERHPSTISISMSPGTTAAPEQEDSQDAVADTRAKPKLKCPLCPSTFRGYSELKRHNKSRHDHMVERFTCREPEPGVTTSIVLKKPIMDCHKCRTGKKYNNDYNAGAHLRREHINPRATKGGQSGGSWPPLGSLLVFIQKHKVPNPDHRVLEAQESTPAPPSFEDNPVADHASPAYGGPTTMQSAPSLQVVPQWNGTAAPMATPMAATQSCPGAPQPQHNNGFMGTQDMADSVFRMVDAPLEGSDQFYNEMDQDNTSTMPGMDPNQSSDNWYTDHNIFGSF